MRWTLLLIALVAGLASLPGAGTREAASPGIELVQGELSLQSSLEGQPLFTADNVGPGDSASGTVTLSNVGTLTGSLSLAAGGVSDTGGALSGQLQLRVEDLSAGRLVWSGPLTGMGSLSLGTLGPGAARVYRLTASLPASATSAVAGSETTVSYTWTATDSPEPPPVEPPEPPPDSGPDLRRPLRLRVWVPARQRLMARGRLLAYVRCNQTCWLKARARVAAGERSVPTRRTRSGSVPPRRKARLVLRLPRRAVKPLTRSLRARGKAAVRVTIKGRSRAGARSTVRKLSLIHI